MDKPLSYAAKAIDANGDLVQYTLDAASLAKGMTLGLTSGVLAWVPDSDDKGTHDIVITAIHDIQGNGELSPVVGSLVMTDGVVGGEPVGRFLPRPTA